MRFPGLLPFWRGWITTVSAWLSTGQRTCHGASDFPNFLDASDIQFRLPSFPAGFVQHCSERRQPNIAPLSGRMGADSHTAHTGNTCFPVYLPGVLGVDRLHRTPLRAQSALHTGLRRLRHNPGHMAFPVRATAGNGRFRLVASGQFFPNLLGKLRQPGLVLGCPAGQPQIDGQWSVLRQRQPRRSHETQPTAQYPAIPPMYPHRPDCHRRRPKSRLLHSLL